MSTPGHAHVRRVADQARTWHTERLAATHAATVTTSWHDDGHLLRVTAACACTEWTAEAVVNPLAPAYDHDAMPTRLRTLHRDHQADVLLTLAGVAA